LGETRTFILSSTFGCMSNQKSKTLANEVAALLSHRPRSWVQVSWVLNQVERTEYWRGHAHSFSEWLASTAPKIGVKERSLWRYLGAGRFYQKLRRILRDGNAPCPPLEKLSETVSPEKLEMLTKLERVVPKNMFEDVAERVLSGSATQSELRQIWNTYRPVLSGRTARGRGTAKPRLDPADAWQIETQREATALTTLMAAAPEQWTGIENPQFYYTMREVILPKKVGLKKSVIDPKPKEGPIKRPVFDMAALVRITDDSAMIMIGVLFNSNIATASALDSVASYCDRLWVALVGKEKTQLDLPEFVGILRVDGGSLEVERPAGEAYPELGKKTGELAKALLSRVLRG
jgi:hypothetical protein